MIHLVETCAHCGHDKDKHKKMSGPNSIGQWAFDLCMVDVKVVGPYAIGGCNCPGYRRKRRLAWR